MESWKQWFSFRMPSFSCPCSYCSTKKLSYTNVIINMKEDDVSSKNQQKSDKRRLEWEYLGKVLPAPQGTTPSTVWTGWYKKRLQHKTPCLCLRALKSVMTGEGTCRMHLLRCQSRNHLFLSILNFRTSLGRCTEMRAPVTTQITI